MTGRYPLTQESVHLEEGNYTWDVIVMRKDVNEMRGGRELTRLEDALLTCLDALLVDDELKSDSQLLKKDLS